MKKTILALMLAGALAAPVSAEVFSLFPFHGNNGNITDSADALIHPATLWTERILVNGAPVDMGVSLINMELDDCIKVLRKGFPEAAIAASRQNCVMELVRKDGLRERRLLVHAGGVYPVIQFSMILPKDGILKAGDWPEVFPMPPGSKPLNVMKFPKRNALYGTFETDSARPQTLQWMTGKLKNAGWEIMTGESAAAFQGGSGEIFIQSEKNLMLILGMTEDNRKLTVSLYMRPLKD